MSKVVDIQPYIEAKRVPRPLITSEMVEAQKRRTREVLAAIDRYFGSDPEKR